MDVSVSAYIILEILQVNMQAIILFRRSRCEKCPVSIYACSLDLDDKDLYLTVSVIFLQHIRTAEGGQSQDLWRIVGEEIGHCLPR